MKRSVSVQHLVVFASDPHLASPALVFQFPSIIHGFHLHFQRQASQLAQVNAANLVNLSQACLRTFPRLRELAFGGFEWLDVSTPDGRAFP